VIIDALLAYFHFTAIFLLFAFLTAEAMLLRNAPDAAMVKLLGRIDLWYLGSAIATLLSGLSRLSWGAKGASFYLANPAFHGKMLVFVVVALLSIVPARLFLRWARQISAGGNMVIAPDEVKRARRFVMMELHIAALLPLLAVLMARGIGFNWGGMG
jgi:putative membrane protein